MKVSELAILPYNYQSISTKSMNNEKSLEGKLGFEELLKIMTKINDLLNNPDVINIENFLESLSDKEIDSLDKESFSKLQKLREFLGDSSVEKNNIKKCIFCGKIIPASYKSNLCEGCSKRSQYNSQFLSMRLGG